MSENITFEGQWTGNRTDNSSQTNDLNVAKAAIPQPFIADLQAVESATVEAVKEQNDKAALKAQKDKEAKEAKEAGTNVRTITIGGQSMVVDAAGNILDEDQRYATTVKMLQNKGLPTNSVTGSQSLVSTNSIRDYAAEVSGYIKKYNQEVTSLIDQSKTFVNSMKAAAALHLTNVFEGEWMPDKDEDGNQIGWWRNVTKIYVHFSPTSDIPKCIDELMLLLGKLESYKEDYNAEAEKLQKACDACNESADKIDELIRRLNEIFAEGNAKGTDVAASIKEEKETKEEETKKEEEPEKDENDPNRYTGVGPGTGPGSTDNSSSSPSYTPPEQPTKEEEEDYKDEDYGDGNEGNETEPTVQDPITTLTPLPTTVSTTTPSSTSAVTTSASTQPTTVTTGTAPVESHSGGGYSGGSGYSYNASDIEQTEDEAIQEEVASSIDNIVKGKTVAKIPTSSAPIAKASTTTARSTGSSVIPAASGIAAAAVIGLGAKAFLDKKKQEEEEEEEEMFS